MKSLFFIIVISLLASVESLAQNFMGCTSQDAIALGRVLPVVESTRNPQMDYCIKKNAESVGKFLGVNVGVIMFEDSVYDKPNICVSRIDELSGTDGTVAIGCNYLQNMYSYSGNFNIIPIVLAHEIAHILDITLKATPPSGMYSELYADFLSGCFMAYRSKQTFADVSNNLRWVVRIGDYTAVGDPARHGTPMQRTAAFKAGFDWYKEQLAVGCVVVGIDASAAARKYLNLPDFDDADKIAGN
ncbi:neutral zinc metallopeptidase [Mucilaginibacter agri]|uniref:Peptidase n=1 Tax=Mucilaginibacter agri TaxID=2695265 RepID=A0A965ZDU1_9SPHI|nr:hypothetical protein [Mucilaginibacter agri]NCD67937.1 hypothetical protein [Mucilaginibacter agri]